MSEVRYNVLIEPSARRVLAKLPKDIQRRIVTKLDGLATDPRPTGAVKLVGQEAWRIRVGDYRVVYGIADDRKVILVVEIGHRREIYRDM